MYRIVNGLRISARFQLKRSTLRAAMLMAGLSLALSCDTILPVMGASEIPSIPWPVAMMTLS
jgi:hypothetical protein